MPLRAAPRQIPNSASLNLVRCCLATAERPQIDAWRALSAEQWVLRRPEVKRAGLMPQLLYAADAAGIELDPELRSAWRVARVHEDLRLTRLLPACREALADPAGKIVLRGLALGHGVYAEPALRHCHDLDLLVAENGGTTVHPSGFPVSRHLTLFPDATVPVGFAAVRREAVPAEVAGSPALILDPVDTLLHVLAHAAWLGPAGDPLWCLDAALLLRRHPGLDWSRVAERAVEWQVGGPVHDGLSLLAAELGCAVPSGTLAALGPPRRRLRLSRLSRLVQAPAR